MADQITPPNASPNSPGSSTASGSPGIKTTEFWLTVLVALSSWIGQIQGSVPEPWGTIAVAVVGAAYTIARAITKHRSGGGGG